MDAQALLADLDERQRAAVVTPSTLVAVIAAAGSGKTRVLTRRIAYRIADGTADARHTLALTFTREAAGELRRRLRRLGLRDPVEAGTFHSVALGVLQQRWGDTDRPAPTIVAQRERLIGELVEPSAVADVAAERTWAAARGVAADAYVVAARAANRRRALPAARIAEALGAYETLKRRRGVIDLDDLLLLLDRELTRDPAFADSLRWRFRHVLVDEAQDLNPVQHHLLRQIAGERRDLFLVGDPAQAIYGFNGSDPTLLADVDQHLAGVEVIRLPTNYRCTPQIVAAGRHALGGVGYHDDARSSRADGTPVVIAAADDEHAEATLVARIVRELGGGTGPGGSVAVLARTHQQLTRLDRALADAGVPVRREWLVPGSPLAAAVRAAGMLSSAAQLRGWAHDTLESTPTPYGPADESSVAQRRVAAAVLEFLRDRPDGNGVALRSWLAATTPFTDAVAVAGVELSTFHAAKGREWPAVVVTGVETGLVPHRTASTAGTRAEEARLLHVACTRAADRLVITHALRRGGYARTLSPFMVGLDVSSPLPVAPPADVRVALGLPRVGRRRRSPGPAPRVARSGGAGGRPAARPALHRRRPRPARPHAARRRRRVVVVDRARAADRGARLPGGDGRPRRPRSPTFPADCGRRRDEHSAVGQAAKSTTTGAWSLGCVPLRALRSITTQPTRAARARVASTRSMRMPRPSWKSPRR